ncbi:DUF1178 family protein [Stakelama saccharophila]|uniref:DUF1178 family protein n=1 Tax=Stakelama saccharophila TaxID=3075605 RepID=A0ABZ0B7T2_9SPHN|nr:DUF1178 family protein [Stakelama sp. W311]WNO52661.1 DUF1178 family protein [Stakelama sp. W311]
MIVFDLRCDAGHVFESWFGSSAAYAEQRDGGLVVCPVCGTSKVEKAVMAPNIAAKGDRPVSDAKNGAPSDPASKAVLGELAQLQRKLLADSRWVGNAFATQARAMHDGEMEQAAIHGRASVQEARALIEDGVEVMPLPLPVIPPNARN